MVQTLHLLSDPPSPLLFISTIIISCYATLPLMSFFQSAFVAIISVAFFVCPHNLLLQHTLFSLCLYVEPSIMLSISSPLAIQHICIWYLIALAQFIVQSNLPQSVSLLNFSFAFASLLSCTWLQHHLFFFILLPICPVLCTLIAIVLAVFFIHFDTVTPAYVAMMQLPLNCFG